MEAVTLAVGLKTLQHENHYCQNGSSLLACTQQYYAMPIILERCRSRACKLLAHTFQLENVASSRNIKIASFCLFVCLFLWMHSLEGNRVSLMGLSLMSGAGVDGNAPYQAQELQITTTANPGIFYFDLHHLFSRWEQGHS